MKTIAYQGMPGAFSHITALKEFGDQNNFLETPTFKDLFELIVNEKADYGCLPIENSLAGPIYENYDLLIQYDVKVISECITKVTHCLLSIAGSSNPEERIRQIKKVYSHPLALQQCSCFFQKHPWIEPENFKNTAAAAAAIAKWNDPQYGAIASEKAAEIYKLEILQKGIEDTPQNSTRFLIISKRDMSKPPVNKGSVLIELERTSDIAKIMSLFDSHHFEISHIVTRPIKEKLFEYVYFLEFGFDGKKFEELKKFLEEIETKVLKLKLLGVYASKK